MLKAAIGCRGAVPDLRRYFAERRGVAAVEFALIAPTLLVLLGGTAEFSSAITASNRVTYVADAIGEMVSRADHVLTQDELKNFSVSASLVNPDIVKYAAKSGVPIESAFKITISSVQFKQKDPACKTNCVYDAEVVFSYTLNGSKRDCATKQAAKPAGAAGANSLPGDLFGSGSLMVVDVETFYRPLILYGSSALGETLSFKRSSYFRPRYLSRINSTGNCPAYAL